jgi:uncharacterized protein (TIGR02996 family)
MAGKPQQKTLFEFPEDAMRAAFEEAIVAEPDDPGNHAAYADWLSEQGDPRGEFIAAQMALEDESLPAAEREQLRRREGELLQRHERLWLGGLAPFLLDGHPLQSWAALELPAEAPQATFAFRRGWLDRLHVNSLTLPFARAIKAAPAMRLVRELLLEYVYDGDDEEQAVPEEGIAEGERWPGLHPLQGATNLTNVRRFRVGPDQGDDYQNFRCYVMSRVTPRIVGLMPRLEELYLWCNNFDLNDVLTLTTLSNLRVLLVYHVSQVHRLQHLDSPTFRNLTHLLIHPHHLTSGRYYTDDRRAGFDSDNEGFLPLSAVRPLLRSEHLTRLTHLRLRCSSMGDEGCREIVESGVLKRLKMLDLRHGCISDEGAAVLADCLDLMNLEWLDLDRNGLSPAGVARMKGLGVPLRIDSQQTDEELHPTEEYAVPRYLCEGEFE